CRVGLCCGRPCLDRAPSWAAPFKVRYVRVLPVLACLAAITAHRHQTPASRAVLRAIVKRPAARVVATNLEALPCAVQHRAEGSGEDFSERHIHARGCRLEISTTAAFELDDQLGAASSAAQR